MAVTTPEPAELLAKAEDPATTPFDYIVIGAGAGGGPLPPGWRSPEGACW